jgi:hypothetical protein
MHDSHVMQLAAQCVLVTDVCGVRPPYGLLVLADGVHQRLVSSGCCSARHREASEVVP